MPESVEPWFVYVLRCKGERLYCGIAKNVDARLAEHVAGKGAKFTRAFAPEAVVATMPYESRSAALRIEAGFKRLSKDRKVAWVNEHARRQNGAGGAPSS